jgi:hypothetical protein
VTIFDAAGSRCDGPQAVLADRVSAALTAACLFLVLALAATLIARPRRRAVNQQGDENVAARPAAAAGTEHPRAETLTENCAAA